MSLDVMSTFLKEEVNGEKTALTGQVTAGFQVAQGWSMVLAGRAGMNPWLEKQADLVLKLVYNQSYRAREVR
jgi:hypothetical protein